MFNVTFVCLGNICRSPMAEAVFSRLLCERELQHSFSVNSRATSDCEEGNPVYPPALRELKERGYEFSHRAKKLTLADIKNADYILVMDKMNFSDVTELAGAHSENVHMLGYFLPEKTEIADPWYTRDFKRAFNEIYAACNAFLDYVLKEHAEAFGYDKRH
ncbi:MAG: low molecular weight phosphotyrosine protein phosphatase [Roseburia sp.]|nr:low molecular weight phosphotyrosine protein phosphatase [Roseburia sp.]